MLVNQSARQDKSLDPTSVLTRNGVNGDGSRKKSITKFNFGNFFKKIPTYTVNNKRNSEDFGLLNIRDGKFTSSSPDMSEPEDSLANEMSELTVTEPNINNYTHIHNNREQYSSFTCECISLQNSEMTSFDEALLVHNTASHKGTNNLDLILDPLHTDPIGRDNNIHIPSKEFSNLVRNSQDKYEISISSKDESLDLIACLSETESDLNFDPYQEENANDYKSGGYHPVSKGEIYYSRDLPNREYVTLRKLGWGHFSTVWLAKSRYNQNLNQELISTSVDQSDYFVALKFVKANKVYLEAAEDEIEILKILSDPIKYGRHLSPSSKEYLMKYATSDSIPYNHGGYKHILKLLDDFEVIGPNGKHICMVFEILGESLLNIIHHYKRSRMDSLKTEATTPEKVEKSESFDFNIPPKILRWDSKSIKKGTKSVFNGLKNVPRKASISSVDNENKASQKSLRDVMNDSKNQYGIPLSLVKRIAKQMLLSVDYMHHCGIIHTDLKPENILVEIKDVNGLLKSIEEKKLSKLSEKLNICNRGTGSLDSGRKSQSQRWAGSNPCAGGYKRSKNSITSKHDIPVKTSKPLSFSKTDIFKEDYSFGENNNTSKSFFPKSFSPKTSSFHTRKKSVKDNSNEEISIKIADLGNATLSSFHFTNQIQTRQYRSPEILLKYKSWGSSTDLWSIGCILFELITGDYLFNPVDGKTFEKDDDHIAQIIELLEEYPSIDYLSDCKLASKIFEVDPIGNDLRMRNISNLKFWGLEEVFVEKYKFKREDIEIKLISDLILKCLRYNLDERYDCGSLLSHPWLKEDDLGYNEDDLISMNNLKNYNYEVPGFTCLAAREDHD